MPRSWWLNVFSRIILQSLLCELILECLITPTNTHNAEDGNPLYYWSLSLDCSPMRRDNMLASINAVSSGSSKVLCWTHSKCPSVKLCCMDDDGWMVEKGRSELWELTLCRRYLEIGWYLIWHCYLPGWGQKAEGNEVAALLQSDCVFQGLHLYRSLRVC